MEDTQRKHETRTVIINRKDTSWTEIQSMSRSMMILGIKSSTSNTSSFGNAFTTEGTLFVTQKRSKTALEPGEGNLQKAFQLLLGNTAWATKAFTFRAPLDRRASAHSYSVPPVCTRSSTITTSFPVKK